MLQISIRLHGALRDKLPAEAKGRAILTLPDGAPVMAVLEQLSLQRRVSLAINDEIVEDWNTILQDGDRVEIFRPAAGGRSLVLRSNSLVVKQSNYQTNDYQTNDYQTDD